MKEEEGRGGGGGREGCSRGGDERGLPGAVCPQKAAGGTEEVPKEGWEPLAPSPSSSDPQQCPMVIEASSGSRVLCE